MHLDLKPFLGETIPNHFRQYVGRPFYFLYGLCSRSRGLSAAPVILPQESILNLRVDSMEPLLRTVGSVAVCSDFRFQLRDPILGCVQFPRKLLGSVERVSAVFFRNAGRPMNQLQDCLTRFVELIGISRAATGSPRKRDHIPLVTIDLSMHYSRPPNLTWKKSYCCRRVSIVAGAAFLRVPSCFVWVCGR
jgi:hypothetical protein